MKSVRRRWPLVVNLRHLIIALTTSSAVVSLLATFYASYKVQRQQLIAQSLESNLAYANKLASSTDDYFKGVLQQMAYAASQVAPALNDTRRVDAEARRLHLQTDSLNSVVIADSAGRVLADSPPQLNLRGSLLHTPQATQALEAAGPRVSAPYLAPSGNMLVLVSQPIVGTDGARKGVILGAIYLRQQSALNKLLGTHYYHDGSYLYVVDRERRILYHPEAQRVGTLMGTNPAADRIARGVSGSEVLVNSRGIEMVAGYSIVPATGWGVVVQRPLSATLAPIGALMRQVMEWTLPLAAVALLLVWAFALKIASPLHALAATAASYRPGESDARLRSISSWYFEAAQLKKAMLRGLGVFDGNLRRLQKDAATDPLTGLGNRRQFDFSLAVLAEGETPFCVVLLDIDFFKQVNDRFGHNVGDAHLRQLAGLMAEGLRPEDLACRIGGEEFALLLPGTALTEAVAIAESLRRRAAESAAPDGQAGTLSLGVAEWQGPDDDVEAVLRTADERLYAAKAQGRNRVVFG
ncbi:diguanylate cyclase [uncultured Pseudacidovorax sp.]|uniref:GGDEF domain-containing protein n=1 Tax=uncultured Pseudacidovorax sp. TaxID=679313 RepID=UPI0025DB9C30|nr:sensor domain-containing diguanylate cyclase [uncultured Pseudacidovorax sp.]